MICEKILALVCKTAQFWIKQGLGLGLGDNQGRLNTNEGHLGLN